MNNNEDKVCNKCEDIIVTIVDGVFSGTEICLTCSITNYKRKGFAMKWIINKFEEWKDEDGNCSLGQNVGCGYATFYEIVSWNQPKRIFGQTDHQMEIEVKCIKARQGVFDAT